MRTITLEEHFVSDAFIELAGIDLGPKMAVDMTAEAVTNLDHRRLLDMDAAGIDVPVLSHVLPTFAAITVENQKKIATRANDQVAQTISAHPDRFAAFAALPLRDPTGAVAELDRAVGELGCKGALINGREGGRFLDDPALFEVLQRAAALQVPLYLHPGLPSEAIRREYYSGYQPTSPTRLAPRPGAGTPKPDCTCYA